MTCKILVLVIPEVAICCVVVAEQSDPSFILQCSVQLYQSLQRCWESDVYLPPLCHRFWKLTLQLVSRYATWISEFQDEVSHTCQLFVTMLFLCFLPNVSLPCSRQHVNSDDWRIREKIVRTVLSCIMYCSSAQNSSYS